MKTALFAGRFDPPTLGHLDLIERSERLCDRLVVGIAPSMGPSFILLEDRLLLLKKLLAPHKKTEVITIEALTSDLAPQINCLIRGIRNPTRPRPGRRARSRQLPFSPFGDSIFVIFTLSEPHLFFDCQGNPSFWRRCQQVRPSLS